MSKLYNIYVTTSMSIHKLILSLEPFDVDEVMSYADKMFAKQLSTLYICSSNTPVYM